MASFATSNVPPGTVINDFYTIVKEINRGGSAVVYEAYTKQGERVACKVRRPGGAARRQRCSLGQLLKQHSASQPASQPASKQASQQARKETACLTRVSCLLRCPCPCPIVSPEQVMSGRDGRPKLPLETVAREIAYTAQCAHPNIVQLRDFFSWGGSGAAGSAAGSSAQPGLHGAEAIVLVYELIDGQDLLDFLNMNGGRLGEAQVSTRCGAARHVASGALQRQQQCIGRVHSGHSHSEEGGQRARFWRALRRDAKQASKQARTRRLSR